MFAAMFISIEPIAGCSGGTSGKRRRMTGRKPRAIRCIRPARSASRITPKPKRHDADQSERDRDRCLRAVESAIGDILEMVVPAADRDREQNEREPDVIQHAHVV